MPSDPPTLVRRARPDELDLVHLHGRDAWDDGSSEAHWLDTCRTSAKYAVGTWYVLESEGRPVASLIVYEDRFSLPPGTHGIGSVATLPGDRHRGHASALVRGVVADLDARGSRAVWLFSDIDPGFYARLGFVEVRAFDDTVCMVRRGRASPVPADTLLPQRF